MNAIAPVTSPSPAAPPSGTLASGQGALNAGLLAKYDGLRVPRYTSYPTAPHFTPAVGPDTYRGWLAGLDPAQAGSLYLHVPFCKSMCW